MKKLLLVLLLSSVVYAADPNLLDKTQTATVDVNAMFYAVLDPNVTPLDRKVTWTTLNGTWTGSASLVTLGTIAAGVWNGTAIDVSNYTNLAVGTYITLTDDTLEVPVAVVTNGDDSNLPTCDNVYDFVIGLSYLSSVDISDDTNLTAGTHVSLTDDTFDVSTGDVADGDDVNVPTCDNVYDYIDGLGLITDDDLGVDGAYNSDWNGDPNSPEKDDVYDYLHQVDTDDDGDVDNFDSTNLAAAETDPCFALMDTLAELNTIIADVNLAYHSRSFVIQDVNAAVHDFVFWKTPKAITLKKFSAICTGGTNVVGQIQEYDNNAANPADVNTADFTITTSQYTTNSFSNPTIDANDWLGWKTASESGTVNFLTVSFEYTDD